jgi:hypothetical protein
MMNHCELVGFEVLTAVTMKRTMLWDATPSPIVHRYFRGTHYLHIQGHHKPSELSARSRQFPSLLFDLEDGSSIFRIEVYRFRKCLGYERARWQGFDSQQGNEISLYSTASEPALGPIQPPI